MKKWRLFMKRNRCGVLVCLVVFLIMSISTAFADFDKNVFQTDRDYSISYDDMINTSYINPRSTTNERCLYFSDMDAMAIIPSIMLLDKFSLGLFCLDFRLASPERIFTHDIIIKVDDIRYNISPLNFTTEYDGLIYYSENTTIILGEIGLEMLNNMKNAKNIKVRFSGSKKNIDFTLYQESIEFLLKTYDLFIEAGGIEHDISAYDVLFPDISVF